MAGYILLLAPNDKSEKISKLFYSDEVQKKEIGNQTLWFVSNSGKFENQEIFQGYAINHDENKFIFSGAKKLNNLLKKPLEGSYFFASIDKDNLRCSADLYGLMPMVWFSEGGVFAVSNSYLALLEIRSFLSMSNNLNLEGAQARMWSNAMGATQMGRRTYCQQVRYAIPGSKLAVSFVDASCREDVLQYQDFYESQVDSHSEAISLTAQRMVATFKTYDALGAAVAVALSGGTDSRLCLAAALKSGMTKNIKFGCNDNGSPDYSVAENLGKHFGFELNAPLEVRSTLGGNDQTALWATGSLGIYDQLYAPRTYRKFDNILFNVGGQGAEISKGNYGWRKIQDIGMPDAACAEAYDSLKAMGVDPDGEWSAEWHYIAFRGAIHSSRGSVTNDYLSRPVAQLPLIGLSRSSYNEMKAPRGWAKNIVQDVLIKIYPELANLPFDVPSKNLSSDYISERLKKLGGPLNDKLVQPYQIIGNPVLGKGVIKTQIRFAQNLGFSGSISPQNLYSRANAALGIFSDLFPSNLEETFVSVDGRNADPYRASSKEANITGKLLALSLVH